MKTLLFRLWQWTWGFPQSLLGLIICLINHDKPKERYRGCIVTHWDQSGSMGVGMFLFLGKNHSDHTLIHEFGHSVQSVILGPLFLPVMGIPSIIWCNLPVFRKMRKEKGISYYSFYPEKSANYLGSLVTGQPCNPK